MTAEEIILKLQDSGHEAYFVGGYVRDMLLGIKNKDKDIATSADPNELIKIFKNQIIRIFPLGWIEKSLL
jgi:tRNA nucleotidyltransferase/poly(A) polymerase